MGAPIRLVSCVSCVSWWYCVNAAETHEAPHQESGMRYQIRSQAPILSVNPGFSVGAESAVPAFVPSNCR